MSQRRRIAKVIAVLFLAAPLVSALGAQANAQDTVAQVVATSVDQVPTAGPMTAPIAFAERVVSPALITPAGVTQHNSAVVARASAAAPNAIRSAWQEPHNPAMMIVGGAAMIVGAVVGGKSGTVVMVGGGILGLVGLWNYLQ
jgi:hypothetical protein